MNSLKQFHCNDKSTHVSLKRLCKKSGNKMEYIVIFNQDDCYLDKISRVILEKRESNSLYQFYLLLH